MVLLNAVSDTLPSLLTILNAIADPVFVKGDANQWVYVNDACSQLFGQSSLSLLHHSEGDFLNPANLQKLQAARQQVVATGCFQEQEIVLQADTDYPRALAVKVSLLTIAGSDAPFFVHVLRDTTHHRQAMEQLQQRSRRERLLGTITKHLLQSLSPDHLLECSMEELRRFFRADRVLFYSLRCEGEGVIAEALVPGQRSLKGQLLERACFENVQENRSQKEYCQVVEDLERSALSPVQRSGLKALEVKAYIEIPVIQGSSLLGLIHVHDCCQPRAWLAWEVEALQDVATQVGRVVTQASLYEQVRQLNAQLESQVEQRTKQLQQALDFEATLKRITDRVRDSLDEAQILQIAVEELTGALGARGSNTALYDLEQGTSTIYYEYNESLPSYQGRVAQMEAFPEVYHQLLDGHYFQFCSKEPNPVRGHVSMLACPIRDDRGVLGDLWLINEKDYGFEDPEIRLVQQVANQCAIAIRQARLYQESQAQVKELERLNQLKDDFLSTVSHELRTPVTSMRVALQLLGVTLNQEFGLSAELQKAKTSQHRIARYYQVLKEECEREISLINDLLDLQRLDGGNHPTHLQQIELPSWLTRVTSGFQERAQSRGQTLSVNLPPELPAISSDQPSLERVFAELLNNACKYTPPGEQIAVTAALGGYDDAVEIQVVNTGSEIPKAELSRIFDKFYRVPSSDPWRQGGTGLGLALVQKLLWHLGGDIAVTSDNHQTAFTVTLPLTP